MSVRRHALLAGIFAFVSSVLASLYPGRFGFGLDRAVLVGVGVGALLFAWRDVRESLSIERTRTELPNPERPVSIDPPGGDFAATLSHFVEVPLAYYDEFQIRAALRSAAETVLERYGSDPDADVETLLATGSWTDDPIAAQFLGAPPSETPSLLEQAKLALGAGPTIAERVAIAVDAIAAVAGLEFAERPSRIEPDQHSDSSGGYFGRSAGESSQRAEYPSRPGDVASETIDTHHWEGVTIVTFLGIGVGVLVQQPGIVLAGVLGVGFVAFAATGSPTSEGVSIARTVEPTDPAPDDEISVSVRITNESQELKPDLRIVDGVPPALSVADGSPRHATTLLPGGETSFTYALTARRGVHEFEETLVLARTASGAREAVDHRAVTSQIECVPTFGRTREPVLLRGSGSEYVGEVAADTAGAGTEFYATREYRPGDEPSHIDWNRRARTGELTTIEFREERDATVVVLVDARPSAYVGPERFEPHALDRCVDAAGTVLSTLSTTGLQVGLTALSAESMWLHPAAGEDQWIEARRHLGTHPAFAPVPTTEQPRLGPLRTRLRERMEIGTQLLFVTPLADQFSVSTALKFDTYGFPVTVISPDPTTATTAGTRLAKVVRRLRLSELREAGIPVTDWQWDEPLDAALARTAEVARP